MQEVWRKTRSVSAAQRRRIRHTLGSAHNGEFRAAFEFLLPHTDARRYANIIGGQGAKGWDPFFSLCNTGVGTRRVHGLTSAYLSRPPHNINKYKMQRRPGESRTKERLRST